MNAQTGIVDIRGKQYHTVAKRVQDFREKHPTHGLLTEIVERTADSVAMKAMITDETGRILATGYAEESRKSSQINRTSALENCETSAIGRALAGFGFGGTEYASANEVENAIHQQRVQGQSQTGAVSPAPAPEYNFPDGPATGITQLKTMVRGLWREVAGCGDPDQLLALLETQEAKDIKQQCEGLENPQHREIWEGDGKDNPGLSNFIKSKQAELEKERDMAMISGGQYKKENA